MPGSQPLANNTPKNCTKGISLAPYSEEWPKEFEKEKALLLREIGAWVQDIQHIGSTAIPGQRLCFHAQFVTSLK
jgi:GrpB-like predicted nucleotidyltransferase (UPF0157 family)